MGGCNGPNLKYGAIPKCDPGPSSCRCGELQLVGSPRLGAITRAKVEQVDVTTIVLIAQWQRKVAASSEGCCCRAFFNEAGLPDLRSTRVGAMLRFSKADEDSPLRNSFAKGPPSGQCLAYSWTGKVRISVFVRGKQ